MAAALDLRDEGERDDGLGPRNIEAEQSFLGCILLGAALSMDRQSALDALDVPLLPEHFFEPVHGRIFKRMLADRDAGYQIDGGAIFQTMRADPALKEIGGFRYMADLVDRSPPAPQLNAFAAQILEAWQLRRLIQVSESIGRFARLGMDDDGETISSAKIIETAEAAVLELQKTDARLIPSTSAEAGAAVMAYVADRSIRHGFETGLNPLKIAMGPMLPKEMYIVAGRPSMGKSALGCHLATRVAWPEWWVLSDDGEPRNWEFDKPAGVLELNGEMTVEQMARRHLADIGFELYGKRFPSFQDLRNKNVSEEQQGMLARAQEIFAQMPIKLLKRSGLKVSQLRSIARRQAAEWDKQGLAFGLLVLDHVGLLRPEGRVSGRYEAQTEIAIDLHGLADDLGIPVMPLVQLSREVEKRDNKRPQLSDLRDSGGWEENADVVMFPFRESYYAEREQEPDPDKALLKWNEWDRCRKSKALDVIFGKIREGNTNRDAKLWCEISHNAVRVDEPDRPREAML